MDAVKSHLARPAHLRQDVAISGKSTSEKTSAPAAQRRGAFFVHAWNSSLVKADLSQSGRFPKRPRIATGDFCFLE